MATGVDDPAPRAIDARRRAGEAISFQWLRQRFARSLDRKDELNWGTTILNSVDQLDQYLWTYGPMVASQWRHAARLMPRMIAPARWIDHGCGQGLAGLLLRDICGPEIFANFREILLIEPSSLALGRAQAIYQHIAPHAELQKVCKRFDDLQRGNASADLENLHIFSNVLDIPGFDAPALLFKALQRGRNVVAAVSPDRKFSGGTARLVDLQQHIEAAAARGQLQIVQNDLTAFTCDNPGQAPAVVWICEVNVRG